VALARYGGNAMALDTSKAYRLTNDALGSGRSLDGTTRLTTAPSNDDPGQRWRLRPQDGGTYWLTTEAIGRCYAIDVASNDSRTYTPVLVPKADFTGQMWHVEPLSGGAFRLRSEFPDDERRWLGVDEHGALVTRPGTAQRWRLTPLAPAPPAPAQGRIPQLCPRGGVSQTEGHADYTLQLVPRGVLRAVVIFADFDDAPGETDPAEIGACVHGHGAATQLFHEQSHGALELEVTVRSDLGWRRLPNPSTAYDLGDGRKQRQFMTDTAAQIGAGELRFDDYDLVLAVTAKNENVGLSPAYLHVPGDGAPSASGEILHGVTFGKDLYTRDHRVLVHELGHVMGLPDLYPYEPGGRRGTCRPAHPGKNMVGYWDLMSDVDHGEHFLGWHRHKMAGCLRRGAPTSTGPRPGGGSPCTRSPARTGYPWSSSPATTSGVRARFSSSSPRNRSRTSPKHGVCSSTRSTPGSTAATPRSPSTPGRATGWTTPRTTSGTSPTSRTRRAPTSA